MKIGKPKPKRVRIAKPRKLRVRRKPISYLTGNATPERILEEIKKAGERGVSGRDLARKWHQKDPTQLCRDLAAVQKKWPQLIRTMWRQYQDGRSYPNQECVYYLTS